MNERMIRAKLVVEYMAGDQQPDGQVDTGEVTVEADAVAEAGGVALAITMLLGRLTADTASKVQEHLGEDRTSVQILRHLANHADGDERAQRLLAAFAGPSDGAARDKLPEGAAPSIDELNEMFRRAGYGTGEHGND
jgi:hypothetical protein